ncbi:hypothetical protein G5I_07415 [Acromyrmex echinatior]|uniref:Uncharacterized protein n=1 Tax=Acromyrmex echinatior TaxID=103372 RepID=F4WNR1_ACREC|nr:hypothetical protein G5I_07415 [Acromyrmex echinatior]
MADLDAATYPAITKNVDEGNEVCKRSGADANSASMTNSNPCFWNILNPHAWFNPERLNPKDSNKFLLRHSDEM